MSAAVWHYGNVTETMYSLNGDLQMQTAQTKTEMFTTEEAGAFLSLAPETLANDRSSGKLGIKFYKLGRSVRYKRSDLEAWLESCARTATA
jgi:excisionase family DNA binding protein